jgi:hypothetical protein
MTSETSHLQPDGSTFPPVTPDPPPPPGYESPAVVETMPQAPDDDEPEADQADPTGETGPRGQEPPD